MKSWSGTSRQVCSKQRCRNAASVAWSPRRSGWDAWGAVPGVWACHHADSVRAIRRALDLGVTMLDTAMSYGQGHNERLIARALHGLGLLRFSSPPSSASSATPAGCGWTACRAHPRLCEASLRRLGRDVIDLDYLDWVHREVPVADTVGAMAALVAEGKVRHLGLSEATWPSWSRPRPCIRSARFSSSGHCSGAIPRTTWCRPPAAGHRPGALQPARPRPAHRRPGRDRHRRQ